MQLYAYNEFDAKPSIPLVSDETRCWPNAIVSNTLFLEETTVDFELSTQQRNVYARAGELSRVFATRAARHDREASLPVENLDDMRAALVHE
jgi:hypothetical protein